jgi:hypothetical protein
VNNKQMLSFILLSWFFPVHIITHLCAVFLGIYMEYPFENFETLPKQTQKIGDKKTSITYEIGKENGRFTKGGKKKLSECYINHLRTEPPLFKPGRPLLCFL